VLGTIQEEESDRRDGRRKREPSREPKLTKERKIDDRKERGSKRRRNVLGEGDGVKRQVTSCECEKWLEGRQKVCTRDRWQTQNVMRCVGTKKGGAKIAELGYRPMEEVKVVSVGPG